MIALIEELDTFCEQFLPLYHMCAHLAAMYNLVQKLVPVPSSIIGPLNHELSNDARSQLNEIIVFVALATHVNTSVNPVPPTVRCPEPKSFCKDLVPLVVELNNLAAVAPEDLLGDKGFIWVRTVRGVFLQSVVWQVSVEIERKQGD